MYENPGVFSINELSDIKKLGQLIMPRIDFNDTASIKKAELLVSKYNVTGFIVFNGDISQVREVTSKLQNLSDIPLFFGCDAERGLGQIVEGGTYFPFLMSQGAINDNDFIVKQARITAEEMSYCGLNLIFAPVLDINSNPDNPIINIRSFGDDPGVVKKLGTRFIREIQKHGILACGKHFPGHGSTSKDSHKELPVINKSLKELEELELITFSEAVESGVSCIMPAHISFPYVDIENSTATVSKFLLTDLLRNKMGFNGIVISDSFKMDALDELGQENQNTLKALDSGIDIILDPEDTEQLVSYLSENFSLIENSLNTKLSRIAYYKKFINLNTENIKKPEFSLNRSFSRNICERSVCRIKGGKIKNKRALIYIHSNKECNFDPFIDSLQIHVERIDDLSEINEYSGEYSIICILSTTISAWTNNHQLPPEIVKDLKNILHYNNESILLNFGSPYIISDLDFFDTIICNFDSTEDCQLAAASVLRGISAAKGNLPVKLDL